jgi:hypothetical protein
MKISRNAPCPCGSGDKYKNCHLGKPLPGEEGSVEEKADVIIEQKKWALALAVVGIGIAIAAGFWRDPFSGIVVGTAWAMGSVVFLTLRRPPPVKDSAGNPAGLDFGRRER